MSLSAASPETRAATRRVALLSVATAAILIVVKAIAWRASGSVAILASLSDSALDLIASLITVYAVRYAAEPPDAEHRFGHGKAEAFSSLMQGGLVFASGALIGREAISALLHHRPDAGAEGQRFDRHRRRPGPLRGRPGLERRGPGRGRGRCLAGAVMG
jgi:divalent metal cation (Fe/Co/Zn/Cd) transporter